MVARHGAEPEFEIHVDDTTKAEVFSRLCTEAGSLERLLGDRVLNIDVGPHRNSLPTSSFALTRRRGSRSSSPDRLNRTVAIEPSFMREDSFESRQKRLWDLRKQEYEQDSYRPFRASSVPWRVAAPLYDQMRIEEERSRRERIDARSRALLRSSSLPPRLEAVKLCGDVEDYQVHGARTPVPPAKMARGVPPGRQFSNRSLRSETPHSPSHRMYNQAVDNVASRAGRFGEVDLQSSGSGWSHRSFSSRPHSAPRSAVHQPVVVTRVPDFASLHERERRQMEQKKLQNRRVTRPEPFNFKASSRSHSRQAPRPASSHASRRTPSRAARQFNDLAWHPQVPHRPTEKSAQMQEHVLRLMRERRESQRLRQEELQNAMEPSAEMRNRVKTVVGRAEPRAEKIDQLVFEKQQSRQATVRSQQARLREIEDRVSRRPLLMEQTDSVAKARRRALNRVRQTMVDVGIDFEKHFKDEELEEMERGHRGRTSDSACDSELRGSR